jgi:hypothetical protein
VPAVPRWGWPDTTLRVLLGMASQQDRAVEAQAREAQETAMVEQLLDQAGALIDSDAPSDALQKLDHILRIDDDLEQLEFGLDGAVHDRIEALKCAAEECQARLGTEAEVLEQEQLCPAEKLIMSMYSTTLPDSEPTRATPEDMRELEAAATAAAEDVCAAQMEIASAAADGQVQRLRAALDQLELMEPSRNCVESCIGQDVMSCTWSIGGRTPFLEACLGGHIGCMEMLMMAGCDVNATHCGFVTLADKHHWTALMVAAQNPENQRQHRAVLRWLLNNTPMGFIELEAQDNTGCTAFLIACRAGDVECMAMLKEAGCDVTAKAIAGMTALMVAAGGGHPAALQWLLDMGELDLEAQDTNSMTAFLVAYSEGEMECMKVLVQAGCRIRLSRPAQACRIEATIENTELEIRSAYCPRPPGVQASGNDMALKYLHSLYYVINLIGQAAKLIQTRQWAELVEAKAILTKAVNANTGYPLLRGIIAKFDAKFDANHDRLDLAAGALAEADTIAKQHEAELLASLDGEASADSKDQSEKTKKKKEKRRRQQEAKRAAQAEAAKQTAEEAAAEEQQVAVTQVTEMTQTTPAETGKALSVSQARCKKEKRRKQLERKAQAKKAAAASHQTATTQAAKSTSSETPLTEVELDEVARLVIQHDATDAQQPGPEPEPAQEPELELAQEPEPEPATAAIAMPDWSAAQVLEWVVTIGLPAHSTSTVCAVLESLELDGDELIELRPKILQKMLQKAGAEDAAALTKQILAARDVAGSVATAHDDGLAISECRICFEVYTSEADSARVPRILTCGHTYCQECIRTQLTTILAQGNSKPYSCPECREITHVPRGQASRLTKNHHIAR